METEKFTEQPFACGDEVIGYEGDAAIVLRRTICVPVGGKIPHRMEAKYIVRKDAEGTTRETLVHRSVSDLGPATKYDIEHLQRARDEFLTEFTKRHT